MTRNKIIAAILLLLTSFAFGRYSAPEKVKIEKQVVTTESDKKDTDKKTQTDLDRNKHVETTTLEKKLPDGTTVKETKTVEDTSTQKKRDQQVLMDEQSTDTHSEKESKLVESGRNKLNLSLLVGAQVTKLSEPLVYGVSASRPFLGPVTLGLWGTTQKVGGVSVGLQF
jgi:hypothetical protein